MHLICVYGFNDTSEDIPALIGLGWIIAQFKWCLLLSHGNELKSEQGLLLVQLDDDVKINT